MHINNQLPEQTVLETPLIPKITLSYIPEMKISELPIVLGAKDVYELFLATWDKETLHFVEQFKVMLLNRASRVLGICTLSTGTSTSTVADIRNIFAAALIANACSIICCHNHPSGSTKPSRADEQLAGRLVEAGKFLEVQVLDQLIITSEAYFSFAEEGIL